MTISEDLDYDTNLSNCSSPCSDEQLEEKEMNMVGVVCFKYDSSFSTEPNKDPNLSGMKQRRG